MRSVNRVAVDPLNIPRTRRNVPVGNMTSLPAGKMVPVDAFYLFREDAFTGAQKISAEMMETRELLMNPVWLRARTFCVPWLAFERFEGSRDQFDRSYMGEPKIEGGAVVPFVETHAMGAHGSNAVYKALGLHGGPTDMVNTMYLEAYNLIWNFIAEQRSGDITKRLRLDATLAPAFWMNSQFEHVVPNFDQAVIDGKVALEVVSANLPVKAPGGTGRYGKVVANGVAPTFQGAFGVSQNMVYSNNTSPNSLRLTAAASGSAQTVSFGGESGLQTDLQGVFAELQADGIAISLANIEMARKTQAFARLRQRYEGHDEEYIIDMLMDGLTIPDQAFKQPILLADRKMRFAQAKRYATDAGNLAESAVSGATITDMRLRMPRIGVGGIVMTVVECMPEQLFERQRDPFFHSQDKDAWPEFLRDTLDPQKVDVVLNADVDSDHNDPSSTFGYEPMNGKHTRRGPRLGGKFYRPSVAAPVDDARMRAWAVETVNPKLSADFYLATAIHTKPFLDTESDPFEVVITGGHVVTGNTVFGGQLVEATGNYDKVAEKAPTEQIDQGA